MATSPAPQPAAQTPAVAPKKKLSCSALEAAHECSVHYILIAGTWRPMLGSVLHKLGDGIDIRKIDSENDKAPAYTYMKTVDDLAKRFNQAIKQHRYIKAERVFFNKDPNLEQQPFHDDHMHVTADRIKPVEERDQKRPAANGGGQ